MVGTFAALLVTAGASLPAAALAPNELPQIFEAACLDGQAKLSPGSAASVGFDALPRELQVSLGTPASAQIWRLNGPGTAAWPPTATSYASWDIFVGPGVAPSAMSNTFASAHSSRAPAR